MAADRRVAFVVDRPGLEDRLGRRKWDVVNGTLRKIINNGFYARILRNVPLRTVET
jgi:hypothetical protein